MAGYHDLSEFERGAIVGALEMGHSISEVACVGDFPVRPFHDCIMNIGNLVKHQIYDIAAATRTGPTTTEENSSLNMIEV